MTSERERLHRAAHERLYLGAPGRASSLWWQCPLAASPPDEPWEGVIMRARLAATLWLQNHDLRSGNQLILSHADRLWSLLVQRGELPNEAELELGPLEVRLLDDSQPFVPGSRFRYQESAHAFERAEMRRRAK